MNRLGATTLLVLVVTATGCTAARAAPLTVFAAASLTDAVTEIAAAYRADTGVELQLTFDASSALRAQIEAGAPADLFLSADERNIDLLVADGLATDPTVFTTNGLAIAARLDGPVTAWTDLASAGVRVAAAGTEVPITRYAIQLVDALAARPDAPVAFSDAYGANVVTEEDNVRAALAKVEIGEADAAIVYATELLTSTHVMEVPLPAGVGVAVAYAGAVVTDAVNATPAAGFLSWLAGPAAVATWRRHGFGG